MTSSYTTGKEIAAAFFEALSEGRSGDFEPYLDDDVVYEFPEGTRTRSRIEGKAKVVRFLSVLPEIWEGGLKFPQLQLWEVGDTVFSEWVSEGRSVRTGKPYSNRGVIIFSLRGDRVRSVREYLNPLKILQALGEAPSTSGVTSG